VKNQLALPEDTTVIGETKFVDIGADSLDTVTPCTHVIPY